MPSCTLGTLGTLRTLRTLCTLCAAAGESRYLFHVLSAGRAAPRGAVRLDHPFCRQVLGKYM